jgi:hypothetical protein
MIECGSQSRRHPARFGTRPATIGSLCVLMSGTVLIRAAVGLQMSYLGHCGQIAWHPKR